MKIIIALAMLLTIASAAFANTDYTCVNNCTAQGYLYSFCKAKCSW